MTLEAVIHPGMPKTGTSSIQATLDRYVPDGWKALRGGSHNLSGLFQVVFENATEDSNFAITRGLDQAQIDDMRKDRAMKLEAQITEARYKTENVVFSAERICGASEDSVRLLQGFLSHHGFKPRVVGYVRKPVSYMQSFFQQQLKIKPFSLSKAEGLWPNYRMRLEKLDRVFGPENVQLSVFDEELLKGRNVVKDFFSQIGAEIPDEFVCRSNESLSRDACALLFFHRTFGEGFVNGFRSANSKNLRFVKDLSNITGQKFKLKRSLCEPIIDKYSRDLEWIENRIGAKLQDLPNEEDENAIGNDLDLVEIALANGGKVEQLLLKHIREGFGSAQEQLLGNLELLRKLHY